MVIARIIAIDGPAASGKSTVGRRLAEFLGYLYFDTGVMYRAITWVAIEQGVSVDAEDLIVELAYHTDIDVQPPSVDDGRAYNVIVNGRDVTWKIRRPQVDANVSVVSTYAGVRKALTEQQRRIGLRGKVVMVGRDIGTVVLPEADLKIFLVATAEERARRRQAELLMRGEQASYEEILESMQKRDRIDSTRLLAPLKPAKDAVILDSDDLTIEEVLEFIKKLAVRLCV